jgi:2-dehydro-3-deoxygalactonokinase
MSSPLLQRGAAPVENPTVQNLEISAVTTEYSMQTDYRGADIVRRSLISCDWGLSAFRLRLLEGAGVPDVVAELSSTSGVADMAAKSPTEFGTILLDAIRSLFLRASAAPAPIPVSLSGMVVSSIGWKQLPYAALPFPLDGSHCVIREDQLVCAHGAHPLFFISGVSTPDDAMRGEECEIVGLFSAADTRRFCEHAVAILPGTHSKSIEVRNGEIIAFRTFLTGELFDILCRHSVLRHSVGADAQVQADEYFETGVRRGSERGLLGSLFSVRARDILEGVSEEHCRGYLSGLLIGDELAAIVASHPVSVPFVLGGSSSLQRLYFRALEVLGAGPRTVAIPVAATSRAASLGHWQILVKKGRHQKD